MIHIRYITTLTSERISKIINFASDAVLRNFVNVNATLIDFKIGNLVVLIVDLRTPPVTSVSIKLFLIILTKLRNLKIEFC